MKYFEVRFEIMPYIEAAGDLLAASLADIGFETFEPTETGITAYVQQSTYDESAVRDAVLDVCTTFEASHLAVTFNCQPAPDENWNATWEAEHHFEPIHIREGLDIQIIPRQAFGSGEHATTRMILGLLTATQADGTPLLPLQGATVIDAGCGTGVLGIAALKLDAARLFAYDIDEWSVRNTLDNMALNGVDGTVVEGDASVLAAAPQADILLANINRNILLNDMSAFVGCLKHGGHLILSGFLEADIEPLKECATSLGLTLHDQRSDEGWQALHFIKNN